jgi:hypothetical protein
MSKQKRKLYVKRKGLCSGESPKTKKTELEQNPAEDSFFGDSVI